MQNFNRKTYQKSEEQKLKELLKNISTEQKRIQKRVKYLSYAGKEIKINDVRWKFLLNPDNDKIIMVSENGELAKYDKWLKHNHMIDLYYTQISNRGYILSSQKVFDTCLVHRLVALAFVPNLSEYETVDHIDGNKENNHYTNLQWLTRSENTIKAIYQDEITIGKEIKKVKISKDSEVFYFESMNAAANYIGCNVGTVANCLNPKQPTKTAYRWAVEKF
jgi:hypothetical protein